ncbi:MAG: hypothetical protein WAU02_04020 [Candidatus Saccharimonadales bacterium]
MAAETPPQIDKALSCDTSCADGCRLRHIRDTFALTSLDIANIQQLDAGDRLTAKKLTVIYGALLETCLHVRTNHLDPDFS